MERFVRDGLAFDLTDAGPRDGDVVVLLHGFPQDRTAWDLVAPVLNAAGLRTLALDQRGYSPGARPAGRAAYRIGECAGDVAAMLDAAGVERAHVVGHDWGGAVAWAFAGRHRDRVRSLVSVSTPHPSALTWALTHSSQGLKSWYMAFFQLPWLPERVLGAGLERSLSRSGLPDHLARRYAARMREPGALAAALAWYRAMPLGLRGGGAGPVRLPTTYLWGRQDFALGAAAARRTGQLVLADYRFLAVEGGHWLPETLPDVVALAVLDRVCT